MYGLQQLQVTTILPIHLRHMLFKHLVTGPTCPLVSTQLDKNIHLYFDSPRETEQRAGQSMCPWILTPNAPTLLNRFHLKKTAQPWIPQELWSSQTPPFKYSLRLTLKVVSPATNLTPGQGDQSTIQFKSSVRKVAAANGFKWYAMAINQPQWYRATSVKA